ncbi:MAG: UTP--glucose-1-phosphate uridylyltransferase [uncultured Chloroflexi bacterium]|uniref:UTP--glucose-1-phosphate uridylyltransferase n=1 Tax=uncultured Chloroflexota bacterium TaxID=166587 RepID=A0A6J4JGA5_9CHLR|nr:MAG: UTP--glucose-1-phosphate uridylyltransferase [uncultured Chloroflexota bacterium]
MASAGDQDRPTSPISPSSPTSSAIRKAGTRLLPATKAQPKEMLPVGRKPTVQYVVEELAQAGITQVLFVTGRKKTSIEDHFDRDPELERRLAESNDEQRQDLITSRGVSFFYTRQSVQAGNADAVRQAQEFVGDEPFVVAFGDTIIKSEGRQSLLQRMIHTHQRAGAACTLAVEEVPADEAFRYGVVGPVADADLSADAFRLAELVEKPDKGTAPSNLAIAPRYVFDRSIFGAIDATLPGRSGELWLTDSIEILVKQGLAVQATRLRDGERRYDIGTFETYFKAFIDFALSDDRYGYMIRQYLIWKADQI